jgi:hypothetical protein
VPVSKTFMTLAVFASAVSTLAATRAIIELRNQLRTTIPISHRKGDSGDVATLLIIQQRYSDVYQRRGQLKRDAGIATYKWFDDTYPSTAEKQASEFWKRFREWAGFCEFVGVLVKHGYIDSDLVFDMINIDVDLWKVYKPLIYELRGDEKWNNKHMFENWEFLINEAIKWNTASPPLYGELSEQPGDGSDDSSKEPATVV